MKKLISKFLKFILPKNTYENRRNNNYFIFYSNFELYLHTFFLRLKNKKLFFLPSRHLGAIYLLDKIDEIFRKQNITFFLWDASLLGAARKQNAIAGSASDIDIAIIFDKTKHLSFLISLQSEFKIKFHNNYNSLQLFHTLGLIDISLINSKNKKLELIVDIPLKKKKKVKKDKMKFLFNLEDFKPFSYGKIYSKQFCIPKNYKLILKKVYGDDWKIPDKKQQVYFT